MKIQQIVIYAVIVFFIPVVAIAQTDDDALFDELDNMTSKSNKEVIATFKSTRLILGQSIERVRKDQLHFRISHVFGKIKGIDNFFGFDAINNMQFSLEYGLTDRIQLGILRSNKPDKTISSSAKLSLFRQESGGGFPLSISYFGNIDIKSRNYVLEERNKNFAGRIDYINQILIGRKLSEKISLQLSPTYVHRNLTDNDIEPNDIFSLGVGGRYLLSRSVSFNAEYFWTLPNFEGHETKKDTFSVGLDIETGGHVFQLYFTNAFALHPGKFALNQSGDFFKRDINFGFSLLRAFNVGKNKKHK